MNRFRYGNFPFMGYGLISRVFEREGEDGSGGDGGTPPSDPTPPADPRFDALSSRLNIVTNALTTLAEREQNRDRQMTDQQERATVDRLVTDAERRVTDARTKLAAAHEEGDSQAIANLTAEVSSAAAEHVAAKMQQETYAARAAQQQRQPNPPAQQQARVDDTNLRNWRDKNKDWYGIDPDMTKSALALGREIESEGVLPVGSTQYFNAVDARLRAKFPDKFAKPQNTGNVPANRGSNMNGNRPPPSQGRIPASVADGYKRMGIDVNDPKVAESMLQARDKAVQKGFLPETYTEGRIITR